MAGARGICCSRCSEKIDRYKDSILCVNCERSYHIECVKISVEDFSRIRQDGSVSEWRCNDCSQSKSTMEIMKQSSDSAGFLVTKEELLNLKLEIVSDITSVFKNELKDLRKLVNSQNKQIADLKKEIDNLRNDKVVIRAGHVDTPYVPPARNAVCESFLTETEGKQTELRNSNQIVDIDTLKTAEAENSGLTSASNNNPNINKGDLTEFTEREDLATKWTTVTRRERKTKKSSESESTRNTVHRKTRRSILCTGDNKLDDKIKGAIRRKWIYVGRIAGSDVTAQDVRNFLSNLPGYETIEINKLTTKGTNSAFSIGVPEETYNLTVTNREPTRITPHSATCLDNVISNLEGTTTVQEEHMADHSGLKFIFQNGPLPLESVVKKKVRIFNDNTHQHFECLLKKADWSSVYLLPENNVDEMWNSFSEIFGMIYSIAFPVRTVNRCKKNKFQNSPEVKSWKRLADALFVVSRYRPDMMENYRYAKYRYDKAIIYNKQFHYRRIIDGADNKSSAVWNVIRQITKKKRTSDAKLPALSEEGNLAEAADAFNRFFTNLPPRQTGGPEVNVNSAIPERTHKSLYLFDVTESEILSVVKNMKNKNSCGHDGVPMTVIKRHISNILRPLCYIINCSFRGGIFPDSFKLSLVKPCYKKGDINLLSNYRPICLTTAFAKIFEKVLAKRILKFFQKFEILSRKQHGFIPGRGTETAIFEVLWQITLTLERGEIPAGLFVDLSKAFDYVDHRRLLMKLERFGIRGLPLKLFESYLGNRRQAVVLDSPGGRHMSSEASVLEGIFQGTILGPILFVVYIDDLPTRIQDENFVVDMPVRRDACLFADDTNVIVSGDNIETLSENIRETMQRIQGWCTENKLNLNADKTNIVIFSNIRTNLLFPEKITLGDGEVPVNQNTKLLGVMIESNLGWTLHCDALVSRLNSVIYTFKILRDQVDVDTLKTVYFANFQSLLAYGLIFWGGGSQEERVFIVQKKALRTMFRMSYRTSCRNIFKAQNIMTLPGLFIYRTLLFMHKNKNYFQDFENTNNTRRKFAYFFPTHKLSLTEHNPMYTAIKLFNFLPKHIRDIKEYTTFRKSLHRLIMNIEPYSISEFKCACER
ncbi:uncharacterized protein LOC123308825 isoform X1 [Coccinella septempunctata]|uniref:uncharacterized protein LOC123308825 isoform X1 n=2 Tax=Coccinella septempunctata TaxID=41139 RepID=UPI001D07C966|nr:uncharacterized protein LOC123308825 isoform X1 [Coccinella septempunctata]